MKKLYVVLPAIVVGLGLFALPAPVQAQSGGPLFIGLGDSVGEGVQSGDANQETQPYSFIRIVSQLMGAPVPLPLIQSGLLGEVGSLDGRSRLNPSVETLNLAVSGADLESLLGDQANATSTAAIDSETDLVLYPRLGSQIEIAESLQAQRVAVWIGNNDVLGAVTSVDQLDGISNITPLGLFTARFNEIAARLAATGAQVVFGTIPDVTKIAYLIDAQELQELTGSTYGLAPGSYTTLVATMGIKLGLIDPAALNDPDLVLDPAEVANINLRIDEFNQVIRSTAAAYGMGVADVAALFDAVAANPPVLFGVPLTTRFLGGFFSLDGVHPSDVGQLIVAMLFVQTFNQHYGLSIPNVTPQMMGSFFVADPFIDKDGDGQVTGRLGAGLLETVAYLIGWSGDPNDDLVSASSASVDQTAAVSVLEQGAGHRLRGASRKQKLEALGALFGPAHRYAH